MATWARDPGPEAATAVVLRAAVRVESDIRNLPAGHSTPNIMGLLDALALLWEADTAVKRTNEDSHDERVALVTQTLRDALPGGDGWGDLAQKVIDTLDQWAVSDRATLRAVLAERDAALRQSELRWRGVWQLRLDLARRKAVCQAVDALVDECRNGEGVPTLANVNGRSIARLLAVAQSSPHNVEKADALRLDVLRAAHRWGFAAEDEHNQSAAAENLFTAVQVLDQQDPGGLSATINDLYREFDDARIVEAP